MAMSYSSLSGPKGASGSIASWVDYTRLDVPVIIDEAQTLLWSLLRTREMRVDMMFTLAVGGSFIPLPPRFLDPIGRIYATSFNTPCEHKDQNFVQQNRNYAETSGTLATGPFTTVAGSNLVSVNLPGHGFSQDSTFYTTGATTFAGATIAGTFPIVSITDANNFVIDITILGTTPNASTTDGGSAVIYTCDNLTPGVANWFGIWNENIYFDTAAVQQVTYKLQYYQSLPLLSTSNQTNFLTNRYPQLMRVACMASSADFMKDDVEYQKSVQRLEGLVMRVSVENDMAMRGMELDTITP